MMTTARLVDNYSTNLFFPFPFLSK